MSKITSPERGGKGVQVKVRKVTRSMTAATLLATLPRGSRILGLMLETAAVSNATTTATLSIGTSTTSTELINALNVLTAGTPVGLSLQPGVANSVGSYTRSNAPVSIYALYAETGTASTTGSWIIYILYTTGNFENDDTV